MCVCFLCVFLGGSSNGGSQDGAEGVAAMTGGLFGVLVTVN